MLLPPPISTLFPYTTLFRSHAEHRQDQVLDHVELLRPVPAVVERQGQVAEEVHDQEQDRAHGGRLEEEVQRVQAVGVRSEEHTSELQSHVNLVCRLLLEKKK